MSHACQMQCSTLKYMNLEILKYVKKKVTKLKEVIKIQNFSASQHLVCIKRYSSIYIDLKNFNIPQNLQSKHHISVRTKLVRLTTKSELPLSSRKANSRSAQYNEVCTSESGLLAWHWCVLLLDKETLMLLLMLALL